MLLYKQYIEDGDSIVEIQLGYIIKRILYLSDLFPANFSQSISRSNIKNKKKKKKTTIDHSEWVIPDYK